MCRAVSDDWLPSRLLDVADAPKLVETRHLLENHTGPYIALSHRWGTDTTQVFKLESTNRADLMHALPLERLPPMFRDAIDFTQRAGFRYLLIDSICILQDSEDDWKTGAAQMSKVYAYCALNLAVDLPGGANTGLFHSRSSASRGRLSAYKVGVERFNVADEYYFTSTRNVQLSGDSTRELRNRAWVMQEHVLSPRTVTFSDQVFWECLAGSKSETDRHGHEWAGPYPRMTGLKDWKSRLGRGERNFEQWYKLLDYYLLCQMTFRSDILVAISAIAEGFAIRMETTYCAGIWREDMPSCLIWTSKPTSNPPIFATRQHTYRAPIWSWASLDFNIGTTLVKADLTFEYGYSPLLEVLDVRITSPCGNLYTDIAGMELVVKGRIEPVELPSLGTQLMVGDVHHDGGYTLDLGPESVEGATVYLLPVCYGMPYYGDCVGCVQALLLKPSTARQETVQTFERIGRAVVDDFRHTPGLKWALDWKIYGVGHMSHQVILV